MGALNIGTFNYYFSPEAVSSLKSKKRNMYDATHITIGLAVKIEICNCSENSSNPLKLAIPYHCVRINDEMPFRVLDLFKRKLDQFNEKN